MTRCAPFASEPCRVSPRCSFCASARFCSLLPAFARPCSLLRRLQSWGDVWRNRRILRFGHRHSQSLRAKEHRHGAALRPGSALDDVARTAAAAAEFAITSLGAQPCPVSSDGRCFVRRPQRIGAGLQRCQELVSYHSRQCLQVALLFFRSRPSRLR